MDEKKASSNPEEKALEPDLPICDAHHHLWDYPGDRYLTQDLLKDINGHNVVKTVFVESWGKAQRSGSKMKQPAEQTALAVADSINSKGRTKVAAGIVGYADLMAGNTVLSLLESHIAAAQNRFRGIRLAPGSILTDKKFLEGFAFIYKYKLVVDAFVHNQQLLELMTLADKYPDTPVIVNHLGLMPRMPNQNPGVVADRDIKPWQEIIKKIAKCPNLYMKLGGLGMDLVSAGWKNSIPPDSAELAAIMEPWYSYCIEKFGVNRCMFESNFPVDKKSFSYNVLWNAHKRLAKNYSNIECNALFYGTAVKVYRLD